MQISTDIRPNFDGNSTQTSYCFFWTVGWTDGRTVGRQRFVRSDFHIFWPPKKTLALKNIIILNLQFKNNIYIYIYIIKVSLNVYLKNMKNSTGIRPSFDGNSTTKTYCFLERSDGRTDHDPQMIPTHFSNCCCL